MTSDRTRPPLPPFQAEAELELLQLILQDDPYPWNPADFNSEAYYSRLEQELDAVSWSMDDFVEPAATLAATFEQAWQAIAPTATVEASVAEAVDQSLFQQFKAQVPQAVLEGIVQRAQAMLASNLALADQLVACVQDLLPGWGEDDLQVLARPFAYAMRGAETEMLEAALRSVRCAAWTELSGIEQARLSLAIARYALTQRTDSGAKHP